MASKNIVGIDIGTNLLKMVQIDNAKTKKSISVLLPDQLVKNGRVVSIETMSEIIRTTLKENGISSNKAAVVLHGDQVFVRALSLPKMSEEQALYNIPFEFKDYITQELKDYAFDYTLLSVNENSIDVLAAACPKALIEDIRLMIRKSGMKLVKLAPGLSAFLALIKKIGEEGHECCFLDIGYESIELHIFEKEHYKVSRRLDIGLKNIDEIVADIFHVDIHLAHTYFLNNYEDCQSHPRVISGFNSISIEINRALNFYRFNNPDSIINDLFVCGGGALVPNLMNIVEATIDLDVHNAKDLLSFDLRCKDEALMVQAIGIAVDE